MKTKVKEQNIIWLCRSKEIRVEHEWGSHARTTYVCTRAKPSIWTGIDMTSEREMVARLWSHDPGE